LQYVRQRVTLKAKLISILLINHHDSKTFTQDSNSLAFSTYHSWSWH